jgi:predicted RNA-binding Zn-ribbon protein involved in translation (DUF1610 family)
MASELIGRCTCPECGFHAAHIKKKPEDGKRPFRYCPECGAQYFTRSNTQAQNLLKQMRDAAIDVPPPEEDKPAEAPATHQEPEQKFKMVFGVRVPV